MKSVYRPSFTAEELLEDVGAKNRLSTQRLNAEFDDDIHAQYEEREEEIGEEQMRELERRVLLSVLDRKWREQKYEMDYLKEGIGLRAMAQRNPLVEYKREGYDMFQAMSVAIKEETIRYLFGMKLPSEQEQEKQEEAISTVVADDETVAMARRQEAADKVLSIERPSSLMRTNKDTSSQPAAGAAAAAGAASGNRAQRRAAKKRGR